MSKKVIIRREELTTKQTNGLLWYFRLFADVSYPAQITEWIRQLYRTREEHVLPVPWCQDLSFHLNHIFTRLKIVNKEKSSGILTDEITNITGIFKAHKNCQKPRTVLIEGEPGMGKTTYCQKLAYDWATKQEEWDESFPEIEVLLFLKCHDIKSDIWEAIDDQLLPEDVDEEVKRSFFKFIRQNQSKVLLVLDGLDEADSCKPDMYFKLVEGRLLPDCHIVLTSRHEAGRNVRRYCDTLWDIVGFTKSDAESFILKYFKNKKHSPGKLLQELRSDCPEHPDIIELTTNPLNTALLCILCEDYNGVLPNNKTQLYIEIVRCVLKRYETKDGLSSNGDDPITVYRKELIQLGRLALDSLRKGEFIEEQEFGCNSSVLTKFGFLSIQTGGPKRKPSLRYRFFRKTFQEFFAGFYLAFLIVNKEIDCNSVVTVESFKSELKQLFLFMSGIVALQSEESAISLVKSIATHINLRSDTSNHESDLSECVTFAFDCILECKTHKRNLQPHLIDAFGRSLALKTLNLIRYSDNYLYLLTEVLKVNTCLTDLHLHWKGIGDSGVAAIFEALNVNTCLTNLNLIWNEIGNSGAAAISEALKVNTCLTNLSLQLNKIGASGAAAISEALKVNTCLTNLGLQGNKIGTFGADAISEALKVNTCLTNLGLESDEIGDSGTAAISEALKVNTCLTNLDLQLNKIGASGAASISEALKVNLCLTYLDLRWNEIGASGAVVLSEALKVNTCLTHLNLLMSEIGASGAAAISEALKINTCLTHLDLHENKIGDSGAAAISKGLKVNTCLTHLNFGLNKIGDSGAAAFSEALKVNTCLTNLNLSGNEIGDSGAAAVSEALKVNTCLTNLDLHSNEIGDSGAAAISEALKVNTCLTNLGLQLNKIGAAAISEALKVNTCLTNLDLRWNVIGASGAAAISKAVKVNTCLTNLDLSGNEIGDSGAAAISEALKINTCLANLNLEENGIGASGAAAISGALKVNTCLTNLDLHDNWIGASGIAAISEACRVNTLVEIDFDEHFDDNDDDDSDGDDDSDDDDDDDDSDDDSDCDVDVYEETSFDCV